MGRKGDIGTKVLSSRVPIKLFTKLLNEADDKGIAIGVYVRDILAKDNFNQGGQTQIEYKDKIVEVPKIEYRDRVIEKKVEIDNPKISQEMVALRKQIELLELELKNMVSKPMADIILKCEDCKENLRENGLDYCKECFIKRNMHRPGFKRD